MINLNQALCKKTIGISKNVTRRFCFMIMYRHTQQNWSRNDWGIWLANIFACGLFTRLGSVRLPLIFCIDGTHTCSAALHFLRKCTKMARLVWLKRTTIFLAWHSQIVKQVEKMYIYPWAILQIKYFLSFSCNKRVFSIKKFRFHIYISDIAIMQICWSCSNRMISIWNIQWSCKHRHVLWEFLRTVLLLLATKVWIRSDRQCAYEWTIQKRI